MRRIVLLAIALTFLAPSAESAPKVVAVDIDGMVHPITVEIIAAAISQAKTQNASLVLVRLNTPGGLMEAMRQIIEKIVSSPVPVVTYVAPSGGRAASAGFFILEAGDVAAMAPGTNTGAAHPVALGTEMDAVMKEKVENDAAASLRSICAKRGRNSELAETAVRQSKSFTEREAFEQHLVDLVANNETELLATLDGRQVTRFNGAVQTLQTAGASIETYQKTLRQKIISAVADPNLAFILLIVGALAIYLEFSSPGLIAPGTIGAILVLIGLSALSVLPINWLGAALLIAAFAMFVLEAKLTSHGVLGVGGAVALPFSAITALLLSLVVRARRNKVETGAEGMIGEVGSAITELAPAGKVFVHGEYWDAVSSRPAPAGARVRVVSMEKLRLTVEPLLENTGG